MQEKVIDNFEIRVDHSKVFRSIGYDDKVKPGKTINGMFQVMFREGRDLISPRGIYVINRIRSNRNGIVNVGGAFEISSEILSHTLLGATHLAIFLVTIGENLVHRVSRLMELGRMTESVILDFYGSSAVEAAADWLNCYLESIASSRGQKATVRFSPGYCNWDIKEQELIFNIIDGSRIGVSLTKGFMMIPEKSISAVMGIGDKLKSDHPVVAAPESVFARSLENEKAHYFSTSEAVVKAKELLAPRLCNTYYDI